MYELTEADFNQQVDHVQDLIEHAVDACDLDLEMEHVEGSLIVHMNDGARVIIGRQPASRELWLAAPGATLHFGFDPARGWMSDNGDETLSEVLGRVLGELAGDEIELDIG